MSVLMDDIGFAQAADHASHVASAVAMSSSTLVSNRNSLIRHRA